MKKIVISLIVVILIVSGLLLSACESCSRFNKDLKSDFTGGLDRIITVYDYSGEKITEYKGRCDVEESSSGDNKILFDLDGKRHIIYGGIVIIDEQ